MALGAQAQGVVVLVVTGGARLVLAGIAVAVPVAWLMSRWIESLLFGLTPTDAVTMAAAIAALLVAAYVAAYLPARRASRVDPLIALRHESRRSHGERGGLCVRSSAPSARSYRALRKSPITASARSIRRNRRRALHPPATRPSRPGRAISGARAPVPGRIRIRFEDGSTRTSTKL